jgi:hypothetical protein
MRESLHAGRISAEQSAQSFNRMDRITQVDRLKVESRRWRPFSMRHQAEPGAFELTSNYRNGRVGYPQGS